MSRHCTIKTHLDDKKTLSFFPIRAKATTTGLYGGIECHAINTISSPFPHSMIRRCYYLPCFSCVAKVFRLPAGTECTMKVLSLLPNHGAEQYPGAGRHDRRWRLNSYMDTDPMQAWAFFFPDNVVTNIYSASMSPDEHPYSLASLLL